MSYRILVTGSREWNDWRTVSLALVEAAFGRTDEEIVVVQGCARGADLLATEAAHKLGWAVESHPAEWITHGKRAGIVRNQLMVDLGADVCLAFIRNNSRGATHCAHRAEAAGIPVRYYREES